MDPTTIPASGWPSSSSGPYPVTSTCTTLALEKRRGDKRIHDNITDRSIHQPQPPHLPFRQRQSGHFEVLTAHPFDPSTDGQVSKDMVIADDGGTVRWFCIFD